MSEHPPTELDFQLNYQSFYSIFFHERLSLVMASSSDWVTTYRKNATLATNFHPQHRTFRGRRELPQSSGLLLKNRLAILGYHASILHLPMNLNRLLYTQKIICCTKLLTHISTNLECKMRSKPLHHQRTTHHPM